MEPWYKVITPRKKSGVKSWIVNFRLKDKRGTSVILLKSAFHRKFRPLEVRRKLASNYYYYFEKFTPGYVLVMLFMRGSCIRRTSLMVELLAKRRIGQLNQLIGTLLEKSGQAYLSS